MKFVLGIDIGTTNMTAVLFGTDGAIYGQGRQELQEIAPTPESSEHKLDNMWQAFVDVCREAVDTSGVDPDSIAGMGFSAYLSGFTACDTGGKFAYPAMLTWKDRRAAKFLPKATGTLTEDEFQRRIGNRMSPSMAVPRLNWLEESVGISRDTIGAAILSPKQYLIYKVIGTQHLDWECARATGLFNLDTHDWQKDQFAHWNIKPSILPRLHKCHEIVGRISEKAANMLGLAAGTPIVIGGGDGLMSSIGSGIIEPGIVAASIGTAAIVRAFRREFIPVTDHIVDCKILPDIGYYNSVAILTGGLALKWFRDNLGVTEKEVAREMGLDAFNIIDEEAKRCSPGCSGLLYLPPLPGSKRDAKYGHPIGDFIGVSQLHSRKDFARAIMEGVAYALKAGVSMLQAEGHRKLTELRFGGGGSRSPLWREIVADTIGLPVITLATEETAALGAAIMAAWGVGLYPTLEDAVNGMVHIDKRQEPDSSRATAYEEVAGRRDRIYHSLYG